MKLAARCKMAQYLFNRERTGNFQNNIVMDDTTDRICLIFRKYGVGLSILPGVGFRHPENMTSQFYSLYIAFSNIYFILKTLLCADALDGFDDYYAFKANNYQNGE